MNQLLLKQEKALKLTGLDYIEFYVGNSRQALHFYQTVLGLKPIAYTGPETGCVDQVSYILESNQVRFVLTSALYPESSIAKCVAEHGDGVKDIAFTVEDTANVFTEAVKRGATPIMEPTVIEDKQQQVIKATVAAYNGVVHSFIQRSSSNSILFPQYQVLKCLPLNGAIGVTEVDHLAVCVEQNQLNKWVDFYKQVFGFHQLYQEHLNTEYSAMNSKVVQDETCQIKLTILEPAPGKHKSQIEEFLSYYRGAGVQHIALASQDIVNTVQTMQSHGIEFLYVPMTYYEQLEVSLSDLDFVNIKDLQQLNILVDQDNDGYLFQAFTKPLQNRPTLFLEIIQRVGSTSFGSRNIRALFEAIEREQAQRRNLD
ncbi:4-hydroxyphenylpyruvate dioxygenase [Nostoc sp. RF31YmG]|nr:4-hydroxyphenylpyruvate dioxygenase [Nostoc sp. RF31YmG]